MLTLKSFGELPRNRFIVFVIFILVPIFILILSAACTLFSFSNNLKYAKKVTIGKDYISYDRELTNVFSSYVQQTNENIQKILQLLNILAPIMENNTQTESKVKAFQQIQKDNSFKNQVNEIEVESKKGYQKINEQIHYLKEKLNTA